MFGLKVVRISHLISRRLERNVLFEKGDNLVSDLDGGFQLDDGYLHGGLLDVGARPDMVYQMTDLLRVHLAQPVQSEVLLL